MKIDAGAMVISTSGTVSRIMQAGGMENPSDNGQELYKIIEEIVRKEGEDVLVRDEMIQSDQKDFMEKAKYTVILPLAIQGEIIGAIIFVNKISGQVYTTEDIELL